MSTLFVHRVRSARTRFNETTYANFIMCLVRSGYGHNFQYSA